MICQFIPETSSDLVLFAFIFTALAALMLCFDGGGGRKPCTFPPTMEEEFDDAITAGASL